MSNGELNVAVTPPTVWLNGVNVPMRSPLKSKVMGPAPFRCAAQQLNARVRTPSRHLLVIWPPLFIEQSTDYLIPVSSTSKTSVVFGAIRPPEPREP